MGFDLSALPGLDEQTKQELQPPCDMILFYTLDPAPCDNPAEWVVTLRHNACGHLRRHRLYCNECFLSLTKDEFYCRICLTLGALTILSSDSLR